MTVGNIGVDFELALESEEKLISEKNCKVTQVCLKLSSPWVGAAVNILRKRGFFLGGILPRWFDKDGFFMQKTVDRPNWEGINLYTERAAKILDFIKDDWELLHK